jgi:hypothetical protein
MGHYANKCPVRTTDKNPDKKKESTGDTVVCNMLGAIALKSTTADGILADSGASRHVTGNLHWFQSMKKLDKVIPFSTASSSIRATHQGSIAVEISIDGKQWTKDTWGSVLFVPGLTCNLFSTTWMERKGLIFCHGNGKAFLSTANGKKVVGSVWDGSGYNMMIRVIPPTVEKAFVASLTLWHERLGHCGDHALRRLVKYDMVDGLHIVDGNRQSCDACRYGKQTASVHKSKKEKRECRPGERFHSDVCFATVTALGGYKAFVTLKDEACGYRMVKLIKSTSEVPIMVKQMLDQAERETGRKAISFRSDNGTEYDNKDMALVLSERRIQHERSPPYVKECNGIAERENRTLCDTARAMMLNCGLSKVERSLLWGQAVLHAAYLRNRVPNTRSGNETPFGHWFGRKPDISHLRVFGSPAFVKIPEEKRKQFDPKSKKTVFVGYDDLTDKVVLVFDREKGLHGGVNRVSNVVVVDEDVKSVFVDIIPGKEVHSRGSHRDQHQEYEHRDAEEDDDGSSRKEEDQNETSRDEDEEDDFDITLQEQSVRKPVSFEIPATSASSSSTATTYRNPRHPDCWKPQVETRRAKKSKDIMQKAMIVALDPESPQDALSREDGNLWKAAMDDEIDSLMKQRTWELVDLPTGKNLVSCKWVLKSKTNPDGSLARRKARLVARGFSQTHGVDYFETFAPVVRYESVRCVLSLAASKKMTVHQFDVKTAFLHGELNEDVFMCQPEGYDDGSGKVCKLLKSLYGLKQSGRQWNEKFTAFLRKQRFASSPADPCVHVRKEKCEIIIVCLYVDDGLVVSSNDSLASDFLSNMKKQFEITVNKPDHYVGMEIDMHDGSVSISQKGYISRVLERFGMADCNPLSTPMDSTVDLDVEDSSPVDVPYRKAIGCLNYISLVSRPDITFAVTKLSRYSNCPKAVHWQAVKRVMRYLKGSIDMKIKYSVDRQHELFGYCDSDWAADKDQRRSTTGFVFLMNGSPISWKSRLQTTSALSSCEAEYMALSDAMCETLWLRRLLMSLDIRHDAPTVVFCDNKGAIELSANPTFHKKSKHIETKFHRIRQEQERGELTVEYVPTKENVSDILTKGVSSLVLRESLPRMGF